VVVVQQNEIPPAEVKGDSKEDAGAADGDTETAKKQRRRLSVAPQHVGDISKDAVKPSEEKKEDDGLTDLETKSKGQYKVVSKSKKGVVPYNRNKGALVRRCPLTVLTFALGLVQSTKTGTWSSGLWATTRLARCSASAMGTVCAPRG
jgi:hypothetical protein